MGTGDRKGGGLMAETLETGDPELAPPPTRRAPSPAVSPYLAPARSRFKGIAGSLGHALAERRLFVLLPFVMIGGLIAGLELPSARPDVLAGGAAIVVLLIVLSFASLARMRIAVLLAAGWVGLCLLPIHGALFGTTMLGRPVYGTYQARVDEIISETASERRIVVSAITPTGTDRPVPVRRARLLVKGGPDLSPGDVISGQFRFAPVPGPIYPGGFDTQFHAYFDGIGAYGNAIHPPAIVASGNEASAAHILDAVRRGISARIDTVLPQPASGVARAIINGDQSAVSDDARLTMATAGIAHVLSVSGLHLTIVAGGVFAVLRLLLGSFAGLARRISVKRLAAVGGMAAALVYYGISGGNVAALRSTLMILLVFGAVLFGRRALTMRNVAVAGIIVIATDPASVFRPSFQLSFAAVVALIGAYEMFRSPRATSASLLSHAWSYGKGVVITSLVAGVATVLFSIYHFQQTSPLGVLGNLLTLPLVGFVMMPAAVFAVVLMPLGRDVEHASAGRPAVDALGLGDRSCRTRVVRLLQGSLAARRPGAGASPCGALCSRPRAGRADLRHHAGTGDPRRVRPRTRRREVQELCPRRLARDLRRSDRQLSGGGLRQRRLHRAKPARLSLRDHCRSLGFRGRVWPCRSDRRPYCKSDLVHVRYRRRSGSALHAWRSLAALGCEPQNLRGPAVDRGSRPPLAHRL